MISSHSSSPAGSAAPGLNARVLLSAREVHNRLRLALTELQKAERNAVLWFAEMVRRKLYKDLGYSSIHQYAELELGFSPSRVSQFLRLSESLVRLPKLRRSLSREEIPWTKAREIATVATPKTEASWIREAKKIPRRVLEKRVKETRRQARAGVPDREQASLELGSPGSSSGAGSERNGSQEPALSPDLSLSPGKVDPATPVNVQLRMTAEQYARYRALLETLRKQNAGSDQVEMILASLEQMALERSARPTDVALGPGTHPTGKSVPKAQPSSSQGDSPADFPRGKSKYTRSPYQVLVQKCPSCSKGTVPTNRGEKALSPKELRTILCDARIRASGKRNTAPVPERLRRAVMERDRFQCRAAGCGRTSFLAVHHLVPREAGGANTVDNMITLCSGCHGAIHG